MTKISIITPYYNREQELLGCLQSVKDLFIPEGISVEHILVNDGSTDNSLDVVKEHSVTSISYSKNKGVNYARNEGIKNATGDYVLFLDSDDELMTDALVKIQTALERETHDIYKFKTINGNTLVEMSTVHKEFMPLRFKDLVKGTFGGGEFISLIRTKVLFENMFDLKYNAFEIHLWHKLVDECSMVFVDENIRKYSFASTNRLCDYLTDPDNALIQAENYEHYLVQFEETYRKAGALKQLADMQFRSSLYYLLADVECGQDFKKSLKTRFSLEAWFCLHAPNWLCTTRIH